MAITHLPPGFRFHPTDVELIMYYLKRKVLGKKFCFQAISELNIYKFSPWDLPDKSYLKSRDREWFFFCPRERKYASGGRMNRATETGYWKTTGKDRPVQYNDRIVGMVKTLVFHQGHAPQGQRTDWVIHEYRMHDHKLSDAGVAQDAFVLCKVFHKNGPGPRNGAQYGAPFLEDEWDDDVPDVGKTFPSGDPSAAAVGAATNLPEITSTFVPSGMGGPEVSSMWPLAEPGTSSAPTAGLSDLEDDDILHFLSAFSDEAIPPDQVDSHRTLDHSNQENNNGNATRSDGRDLFSGLPDLPDWQTFGDGALSLPETYRFPGNFMELDDLARPLNTDRDTEMERMLGYDYSVSHFSAYPNCLSSTQLPWLADGSTGVGVGNDANVSEVNNGDVSSTANEDYSVVQQPSESTQVNQIDGFDGSFGHG